MSNCSFTGAKRFHGFRGQAGAVDTSYLTAQLTEVAGTRHVIAAILASIPRLAIPSPVVGPKRLQERRGRREKTGPWGMLCVQATSTSAERLWSYDSRARKPGVRVASHNVRENPTCRSRGRSPFVRMGGIPCLDRIRAQPTWKSRMDLRFRLIVICAFALASASQRAHAADALRVGAAAVNVPADDSMVLGGMMGPTWAKGQEGELRATAVVVEQPGSGKVAIVACDVLFVERDFLDPAIAKIEALTGIPASHVLVNATHTHHAPSTSKLHGYDRDRRFVAKLADCIVEAARQANDRLADAKFFFKLSEEKNVGMNSRWLLKDGEITWSFTGEKLRPTGPFDPQLPVLAFGPAKDKPWAVIFNHSTHTIGTRAGAVRSPSFYGLAAQELEGQLGGVVCFLEGASGSTHNLNMGTAQAIVQLKADVRAAIETAEERPVLRVAAIKRHFQFRVRTFDEAVEDEKVARYTRKYFGEAAERTINIFREMRQELKPQQGQQRESWLQVMLIGDVAIVGVPAEYFTVLGMDIKKRSPFANTYVAELANDWIGYLPDKEGHALGGYQTWMGLHSYAEVGTGERVADEIVAMLEELKAK